LFDYTDDQIGKTTGIDIKERKMTLPLIHALNIAPKKEKEWLINSVKNHNRDKNRVKEVIEKVKSLGGIEYTTKKMLEYQQKANDLLKVYPESDYKTALITMVNYVIDRKI
ncbi:MAG: polyprenyl synthetase family protein, partial [Flavobacteriaceae bacterium]|nr:polyprenyl synthetase family protein [Flavobacteriaceae bacterium]